MTAPVAMMRMSPATGAAYGDRNAPRRCRSHVAEGARDGPLPAHHCSTGLGLARGGALNKSLKLLTQFIAHPKPAEFLPIFSTARLFSVAKDPCTFLRVAVGPGA